MIRNSFKPLFRSAPPCFGGHLYLELVWDIFCLEWKVICSLFRTAPTFFPYFFLELVYGRLCGSVRVHPSLGVAIVMDCAKGDPIRF